MTKTWIWRDDIYGYGDAEAKDVTVAEGDGSIYVTGHIKEVHNRKTIEHDCFVLKLDADLNRIYAKSFGFKNGDANGNSFLTCMSIQVTRNSDHIYLGGNSDGGLFFGKAITNF